MQRLLLATIFLAVMGGIEASACMIVPFQIDFGSDTATVMQVGSGKRCSFTLHAAAQSAFSGVAISAPARNGTARADYLGPTYQSRPGYKGADAFAFTVTGTNWGRPVKSTVQVGVTVQ